MSTPSSHQRTIPLGGSLLGPYTTSHSMRCQRPSVTGTLATLGVSQAPCQSGKTRSSKGPDGAPYMIIAMLPSSGVKRYSILLLLLTWPCQGSLAIHQIPTYTSRVAAKSLDSVPGADPPTNPTG